MAISLRLSPAVHLGPRAKSSTKDVRLWLGIALIVIASLVGGKLFTTASHRTPAVVVIHDLAAGSLISSGDVQVLNVALPHGVESMPLASDAVGKFATHDLISGSVLHPFSVGDLPDTSLRSVSVPIKAGHLPAISYGSSVDVWFTPSLDGAVAPGPSQLIASNVLIDGVPSVMDSAVDSAISLRLSSELVAQVMQAMRDGSVDIAVVGAHHG